MEARTYIWLTYCWSGDNDVSSPSPARTCTSGVFSEESPSDGQVSVQERNNAEREREKGKLERKNSLCDVYLITCHPP